MSQQSENDKVKIIGNSEVTLHFSLNLPDGTEALSTFGEEPITITMGSGSFQSGMEMAILGLTIGDKQTITLTPDQAYGYPDSELIFDMPLSDFDSENPPEVGQIIAFNMPNGDETPGMIVKLEENDIVKVDFNHPLSGYEVTFKVEIININNLGTEIE